MQCLKFICRKWKLLIKEECKVESYRNGKFINGRYNCNRGFIF